MGIKNLQRTSRPFYVNEVDNLAAVLNDFFYSDWIILAKYPHLGLEMTPHPNLIHWNLLFKFEIRVDSTWSSSGECLWHNYWPDVWGSFLERGSKFRVRTAVKAAPLRSGFLFAAAHCLNHPNETRRYFCLGGMEAALTLCNRSFEKPRPEVIWAAGSRAAKTRAEEQLLDWRDTRWVSFLPNCTVVERNKDFYTFILHVLLCGLSLKKKWEIRGRQ